MITFNKIIDWLAINLEIIDESKKMCMTHTFEYPEVKCTGTHDFYSCDNTGRMLTKSETKCIKVKEFSPSSYWQDLEELKQLF